MKQAAHLGKLSNEINIQYTPFSEVSTLQDLMIPR